MSAPVAEPLDDLDEPADAVTADPLSTDAGWGRWSWPLRIVVAVALVAGVVLRFVTGSAMWLDEALSVNIADLPLGEIPDALRRDGHPPLYYVLLHGWMAMVGDGTVAVRAFSGVWAVAALPLVWLAADRLGGRRVALYAVTVLAVLPYALRYGTETRMYAMLTVLALAAWLLGQDALERPTPARLAVVALVVAALLWTHYWALWFLTGIGAILLVRLWRARRAGRGAEARATARVIAAVVVGGLTFLPWVPTLLYQGAHTGTPWARPSRPTEMLASTLADLGGGPEAEAVTMGWSLAVLALVGTFGHAAGRRRVQLDLHSTPTVRPHAAVIVATMALACVAGYATDAAYASRYASILLPFVVLLVAVGIDQFRSRPLVVAILAALSVLGAAGAYRNVTEERSDAEQSAAAIEAVGESGDVVVYCPDQLGPSTTRVLADGFDEVTYPRFGRPTRVDWVDYTDRLAEADPTAFAGELLDRAAGRRIFLVYSTSYDTHEAICPAVHDAISVERVPRVLTNATEAYEPAGVVLFEPAAR